MPQDDSRPRSRSEMLKQFPAQFLSIASTTTKGMRRLRALLEISSRPLPPEKDFQVRSEMLPTLLYQWQAKPRRETRRARPRTKTKVLLLFLKSAVSGEHAIQRLLYWMKVTRSIYSTTVTSKVTLDLGRVRK